MRVRIFLFVLSVTALLFAPTSARAQSCGSLSAGSCIGLPTLSFPSATRAELNGLVMTGGGLTFCVNIPPGVEWMTFGVTGLSCSKGLRITGSPIGPYGVCGTGNELKQGTNNKSGQYKFTVGDLGGCAGDNFDFYLEIEGTPPVTPGPATPGPATPGPATPGPATPGPATPGPATPGPYPFPTPTPIPTPTPMPLPTPPLPPIPPIPTGPLPPPPEPPPVSKPAGPRPPFTGGTYGTSGVLGGCDRDFDARQRALADARVLRDVSVGEEIIRQGDSVLALSCFDQALKVAAKAGRIFSDVPSGIAGIPIPGVTTGLDVFKILSGTIPGSSVSISLDTLGNTLGYVVAPSLVDFLVNFVRSIGYEFAGLIGGALDFLFNALNVGGLLGDLLNGLFSIFGDDSFAFSCDGMQKLWDALMGRGLNSKAPLFTLTEMINGKIPDAGDILMMNLNRGSGPRVRQSAIDALDINPGDTPYFVEIPAFTGDESIDDVVEKMK